MDAVADVDTITRADLDTGRSGAGGDTNGDIDRWSDAAYGFANTNGHSYPYIHADANTITNEF